MSGKLALHGGTPVVFYNRIRRHSYLDYLSPEEFEHSWRIAA